MIRIDTDSYKSLGEKYRLPSPKCDKSVSNCPEFPSGIFPSG